MNFNNKFDIPSQEKNLDPHSSVALSNTLSQNNLVFLFVNLVNISTPLKNLL